ncbi:MAG: hypothetical protein ACW981_01710 [Candidatus Hodarchaeales archaeon]|jgi:hypothetical protein
MTTTSNWAIFAKETEVIWHFGDLSQEFIDNTVNFLNGLDAMGTELFGSGVASITLDQKSNKVISASEIFVVSLGSTFFFIASDPLITMRLIYHENLPDILEDQMRSILIGQATNLYANLYTESSGSESQVDDLFWTALYEIGYNKDVKNVVEKGRCSFSEFGLLDMMLFHYQLRKIFAEKYPKTEPWAIIADESGPIHLKFGKMTNATSLAGYLSVLFMFCKELFDSSPKSLVFGGDSLIPLEVVNGDDFFLSLTRWDTLFKDKDFLKDLNKLDRNIVDQLGFPITQFLAEKLSTMMQKELKNWSMNQLITAYKKLPKYLENLNKESKKK